MKPPDTRTAEEKLAAVGAVLSEFGCQCDCGHDWEGHDDDCEMCVPCRVQEALGEF